MAAAFVAGILTIAFVTSVIIQQRRFLRTTRSFSGQLLAAQEEERARIARELHDDVIQRVALLGHSLDELAVFAHTDDPTFERRVRGLRAELVDFAEEIRGLARRMHPAVLDHLGLPAALEALAGEVAATSGVELRMVADDHAADVPPEAAACLYRVAQEALRNVVRHARARAAEVRLERDPRGVTLVVTDDGVGFDPLAVGAGGLGLTSMKERARKFGGRVSVDAAPGRGTRVTTWLPLQPEG